MDKPGAQHHRERIADAIRDELSALVEGELADPRIGLVSVTDVQLAPDSRSARIFVAVQGDDEEAARNMQGLRAATNFIRHQLAERLRLRHAPELTFHLDRSEQSASRIEELLSRVQKRNKSSASKK
jgi:ribosome-binding factor A